MKHLESILNRLEHKAEHAEEILVEEHVLNMTPDINKKFFELAQADKNLAVAIEHLHNYKDIQEKKSLTELLHIALLPYENRTIHIENEHADYPAIVEALQSYRNMDFVAGYKHNLFEPLSIEMWIKHKPVPETRMVFYALDMHREKEKRRESEAIKDAAKMLGSLVTIKRKRYNQYASRTYTLNSENGLHARPAAQLTALANKYAGDSWIRTENMEVNARSIMGLLMLAAEKDKKLTILYKPKENSEKFYNEIEKLEGNGQKLFKGTAGIPEGKRNI